MYSLLLVFGLIIAIGTLTCTVEEDWGGSTFVMYRFATKEDCDKEVNCQKKIKVGRGCKEQAVDTWIKTGCFSKDVLEIAGSCSNKECDLCTSDARYGKCKMTGSRYYTLSSTSCTIGDDGSDILVVGGALLGVGVCLFICCYLLIPIGAVLLCIGCCVGCRDIA